jgi:hypothetical protein
VIACLSGGHAQSEPRGLCSRTILPGKEEILARQTQHGMVSGAGTAWKTTQCVRYLCTSTQDKWSNEPSFRKLVAKHNSRVEQRLSRIVVLVAALLFVEPVFFGFGHPRHFGFRYHRLNRNKRWRFQRE